MNPGDAAGVTLAFTVTVGGLLLFGLYALWQVFSSWIEDEDRGRLS